MVEVPSQMHFSIPRQVFIENDANTELVIESEEDCNGTNPQLLIHIRAKIKRKRSK
jgi:pantothenate kinase